MVVFPDEESKQLTKQVELFVLAGGGECAALESGASKPGDDGYRIEDQASGEYPSGAGLSKLKVSGEEPVLFFARARQENGGAILVGCTAEPQGGGREVEITLGWFCRPQAESCGSSLDTECTDPDTCDGAGNCLANDASSGAPCGDQGVACHVDDTCDGAGNCTDNGLAADDTSCGSSADTECDNPDSCQDWVCQPNYEQSGTTCGSSATTTCSNPDSCDGSGTCLANHLSAGAEGNGGGCPVCQDCNGSGACANVPIWSRDVGCNTDSYCCNGSAACVSDPFNCPPLKVPGTWQ